MSHEPRDPGLAAMLGATVRVADGSGVVIRNGKTVLIATAAHVVRGGEIHAVRKGSVFSECPVICRDDALDVAFVTPPPELEAAAIAVADEAAAALPGDPVWSAGFPRGWKGPEAVIVPGTVAGVGEESWVNLDGTWGNSGGPLCRVVDSRPFVTGVVLGPGGAPNAKFEDFVQAFKEQLEVARRTGDVADQAYTENPDEDQNGKMLLFLGSLFIRTNNLTAELLEEHFRTGFLRFAPVADLRKLLDTGDGRPSI